MCLCLCLCVRGCARAHVLGCVCVYVCFVLRVKDSGLTRDKVIETVFSKTDVPFIRIFGDFPNYVALCKEKDAYKLLKNEIKITLGKAGIKVLTPIELKREG